MFRAFAMRLRPLFLPVGICGLLLVFLISLGGANETTASSLAATVSQQEFGAGRDSNLPRDRQEREGQIPHILE